MLNAGQLGRTTGRQSEDDAGERFEDQVLAAVSQHRHDNEDGEPARPRFGPDLGQRFAKATLPLGGVSVVIVRSLALETPDRDDRGEESAPQTTAETASMRW